MVKTDQILSCDWGTSSFRLRLVRISDATIVAETTEGKGIAAVNEEWLSLGKDPAERFSFFQQKLSLAIQALQTKTAGVPIIISGMASSSIGMMELPYGDLPFSINKINLPIKRIEATPDFPNDIIIVSGLKSSDDVMRGEETMVLGLDNVDKDLYIFPGTHSKHLVFVKDELVEFQTFMTGEVFNLLSAKSILSKSVSDPGDKMYYESFKKGILKGVDAYFLNSLFHTRTNQLLHNLSPEENHYFLSGLLIGNELADIRPRDQRIVLIANNNLAALYSYALEILTGNKPEIQDADKLLIKGHCRLDDKFFQ